MFQLNKIEWTLWLSSSTLILLSFLCFDGAHYLTLAASLIGVTSLIYSARGNPFGPFLMIIFSILYGIISFSFHYYGEMITYLGMTLPMSIVALASWLKNPYKGNKSEVEINSISKKDINFMLFSTMIVTIILYFILNFFHTANLIPSTLSVATSFLAAYLSYKRNPYFALAYAANDIILIILWILASITDKRYISVFVCFVTFFINDLYGFYNWKKIKRRQTIDLHVTS